MEVVLDIETADPDDFLALLWLLGRPEVSLKAITIMPGSADQVGLVRAACGWFGKDLPIGAWRRDHKGPSVSPWHYRAFGQVAPAHDAAPGPEVLLNTCGPATTLVTGAALKNLGAAILLGHREERPFRLGRLVAQGGFAGEGVVPRQHQLRKFLGQTTCPTWNLDGDRPAAHRVLQCQAIGVRRFVSKNVCHGVVYDQRIHAQVGAVRHRSLSLELIYEGLEHYLARHAGGKKLHDVLAACCAVNEAIGEWAEVELYHDEGGWGARPLERSGTWIITSYDRGVFLDTFLGE